MNVFDLDLSALAAFDAVRRHRSVSAAADELGLAQPTLSNRLRSLRRVLGDPLFVRTAEGMTATPFAEEFGGYVAEALALIERGVRHRRDFDPAREARTFSLVMTDIAEAVILPALLEHRPAPAGGIRFRTVRLPIEETHAALQSGEVDLAIGFVPGLGAGIHQQLLYESDYICIANPARVDPGTRMDLERFLAERHAIAEARGTGHRVVEEAMQRQAVQPKIDVRVQSFLALPQIVSASDLIATVPRALNRAVAGMREVRQLDHPLDLPRIEVRQFWHERFANDPANVWLRGMVRRAFSRIDWDDRPSGGVGA